ncbi:hypothetical protein BDW02DRAFT_565947 [Decorospora gaudefroyi]|uniref:Uncharacterized protein n=1 Tax=Decorospora gaudefroyi TaxID=184978 RepID=A0A6A5KQ78_9PLEO|nr:hypothetical protein BDW02DRAFT_565947 [Decorospora gaudefroyi]
MQYTIATLFAVLATAVTAAPADMTPRQTTFTEFAIWEQSGCPRNSGRIGTINLTTDTACQNFQPGVVSGKVDLDIPAGCRIQFFVGQGCNSVQSIVIPRDQVPHSCFELGPGKNIGSALVSGTCG